MPFAVAAAAVTAYGAMSAADEASSAQDRATQASQSAQQQQTQLARDQFDFNKQQYNEDIKPAAQRAEEMNKKISEEGLAASQQQRQFAGEQNQYYKDTFQPVEKKMVDEANNYDSAGNVAKRSGIASANVNQQFSNARGQGARLAGRYGLGSTAFGGPAGASERSEALGAAGAATGAAFDTMDKGIALRAGAANFGRNMPNTAASYYAGGNGSAATASGAAGAGVNNAVAGGSYMSGAFGSMNSQIAGANSVGINGLQNNANAWSKAAAGIGSAAGGLFSNKDFQSNVGSGWDTAKSWFTSTPTYDGSGPVGYAP